MTLVHEGLSPAPGNAGFERIKADDETSFDIDSYAHYLHHKYFEVNYGADGLIPLDKWFGLWHDGSKEADEQMKERFRKKKQKLKAKNLTA